MGPTVLSTSAALPAIPGLLSTCPGEGRETEIVTNLRLLHISSSIVIPRQCSAPSSVQIVGRISIRRWFNFKPLRAVLQTSHVLREEGESRQDDGGGVTTLREICRGHVPDHVLSRAEGFGYVMPTDVQSQAPPVLLSGRDCVIHAQVGLYSSGKTLAYLLLVFSVLKARRSAVQALIVVPTRELGMQVTKVARMLASKAVGDKLEEKSSCTVMALLDGGMLRRHKSWLKAEPPTVVVATRASLCQMLDKQIFKLDALEVLVIDERDVVHVHVNAIKPLPSCLQHKFVVCTKKQKHAILLSLLHSDAPTSAIVFVGEQSEKSKKAGNAASTVLLVVFLNTSYRGSSDVLLLEEDMNFNSRAASLSELRQGEGYLLVATDIAARGVDLPETTHIYNFDLPRTAVDYLHRAGRTGRKPFSDEKCNVTNIIVLEERFVLQRYENELMFNCEEVII
ncbi:unnamed protein product [Linum tenue]|uniref:RNA helicase n=1 Tax=Linum tenue TaxID=586396 RepID=A0AAV0RRM6_9ROSI|nr:unnamed protein product [Linum tenue]